MIPPFMIHAFATAVFRENGEQAVIILLLHGDDTAEVVAVGDNRHCNSLPQLLRKAANEAEEGREADLIATSSGSHRPGDVFRINDTYKQRGWAKVLVTARAIHPWGIEAFATAPTALDMAAEFHTRLNWADVTFIGRPKVKEGPTAGQSEGTVKPITEEKPNGQ